VLGEMAVEQVCARVARLAHDTIAGVDEVSVTVLRGSCADTMAATGPLAAGLEEYQYATDSGPCLHAARHRETVLVADMRTESRWPAYTARAVHAGVFGSLSVPVTLPQGSCGALNLYTRKPSTFDRPGHQVAVHVAEYAAITLTNTTLYAATTRLAEQCKQARTSPGGHGAGRGHHRGRAPRQTRRRVRRPGAGLPRHPPQSPRCCCRAGGTSSPGRHHQQIVTTR